MTPATARGLVRRVGPDPDPPADAELVSRFARSADPAAFAALVRRHGPMVLAVCRRMLPGSADADDAFQATFLVLLRKAGGVRPPGAVGGWLHGVAVRTAQKARVAAARRRRREMTSAASGPTTPAAYAPGSPEHAELRAVIDEELARLPEPLRAAVVLCDLGGKTRAEAAADLGCPEGTVAARLHRARKALADRLARRGVTAPAALAVASAAVPADLFAAVAGFAAGGPVPAAVRALADGVVRGLTAHPLSLALTAIVAAVLAAGAGVLWAAGVPASEGTTPVPDAPPAEVKVGPVYAVGYSPDGSKLVHVGGGKAVVRDAATKAERYAVDAEFAQFSGDGTKLFVLVKDEFRTLDAATGKALAAAPRNRPKTSLGGRAAAFTADGARRAEHDGGAIHLAGDFAVRPVPEGQKPVSRETRVAGRGWTVAFSPDGTKLAGLCIQAADFDGRASLAVWETGTGRRLGTADNSPTSPAYSFAWNPAGTEIVVGSAGGAHVYDATDLTLTRRLPLAPGAAATTVVPWTTAVAWSPDGKTLAAARQTWEGENGGDGPKILRTTVRLLDAVTGQELRRIDGFPNNLPVVALVFRPDGRELACGAGFRPGDGPEASDPQPAPDAVGLRVVALDPPAEKAGPVHSVGYSADGTAFVFVGGGKAMVRDAATRAERFSTDAEFAHFNGDGTKLFAFTADDRFLTLDAATGKVLRSDVRGRPATAHGMRWAVASADGLTRIESAGVSHDYTNMPILGPVPLLDGQRRGDPAGLPAGHRGRGGAFSPDGTRYAGIHAADPGRKRFGPVGVWKTDAGGTRVATLSFVPDWPALALAWAPDGKQIAVGYSDGVRVYDADTSDRLKHLPGGPTTAVAWSPDGATLAVGDGRPDAADEKTVRVCVRLLDVRSGDERRRIDGFPDNLPVVALAFRPDGKELACGAGLPPGVEHPPGRPAVPNAVGLRLVALDLPVRRGRNHVSDLSFAPDGKTYLVVAGGKAAVRDFATDRTLWEADAEAARFTTDGTAVVTMAGAGETAVTRRATATGTAVKTHPWPKLDAAWNHVAFNQDGYLYAAHFDYEARLFAAGGEEPVKLEGRHAPLDRVILRPTGKAVTFSPDGRLVAAVGVMLTTTENGAAVWDVRTGKRLHGYPNPARSGRWVPATAVAFSADSKQLAVAVGKVVQLFDTDRFAAGVRLPDTPGSGPVTALAFGPDGKQLAVGYRLPLPNGADKEPKVVGHKTEVQLIDLVTNKELKRFDGFEGVDHMGPTVLPVTALAFSPDGQTLLAGTGRSAVEDLPADAVARGEVKRFALVVQPPAAKPPVPEWRELVRLPDFDDRVQSVAFAPDGKTLAVGGRGGAAQHTLTMWDAATQKKLWAGGPVPAGTTGVAFSPDGRLVAATRDKTTGLYEAATGRSVLMNPPLPGGKVVAFSPDGKHLAVGDGKRTVVFPAVGGPAVLDTQAQPEPPAGPTPAVVAWSPNGTRLVTSWHDPFGDALFGSDIATLQTRQLKALIGHPARVTAAAWSPDGKVVATGCGKGDVIVWDAETRKELKRTRIGGRGGEGLVRALAFAPDGRTLAAAVSFDEGKNAERVVLLDTVTGNRNQDLQGFGNFTPVALAFAPDGRTLAVGLADFLPQVQPPPGAAPRPLGSVALFTTDPEPRAAAPQPQPPAVRPAPAWREAVNLPFDDGPVHSVAFRRDGKEFAAGGDRSRAVAWTVPGFTKRHTWVTGGESPTAVGYSPDGRVLAVVDDRLSVLFNTATDLPFPARAPFPPAGRAVAFSAPYGPQSGPVRHRFAVADGKTAHVVTWPETLAPITKSFGPVPGAVAPGGEPGVGVAWAPDGRRLVFVPNAKVDGRWLAQVWDAGSGAGSAVLAHGTAPVTAVAWSPDGKLIATGCRRGDVVTWDAATLKERTRSRVGGRQNASEVHALAFSPDGQTLAAAVTLDSGLNVERVVMLDPATGARTGTDLTTFRAGGELTPRALAFSPDGKLLAVGLDGRNLDTNARVGAVRVYTTEPEPDGQATGPARPAAWRPRPVTTERAAVAAVAFAPNGKTFALAGSDGVVEVWDAATLKGRATSTRVKAPGPGALAFMPTTSFLATADADGVGLHDPSGIKMSHRVWSLPTQVVAFAPNGKQIALRGSSNGGLVRVLPFPIDPATPGGRAREDTDEVLPVTWSPDGKRLMAVIRLPSSGFWALTEPTVTAAPHVLGHGPEKFGGVAWSGEGKWIVTGGHDGKVIVTDSAAMKEVRKWSVAGPGERARVRSVVLSPDGATVFTGIEAWPEQQARPTAPVHAVVGWELATGREVVRLTLPPGGPVDALALSPDGRLLVAGRNPVAAPDPAPSAPALLVWERP